MSEATQAVPDHVPAELVFDFDIYNPPGAAEDYQLALKKAHDQGCPDIFWTPRYGGHWILARGQDMYQVFADHEHFSSRNLTVPKSTNPPVPLMPIFSDPPDHMAYRAVISPFFAPKSVAALSQKARELAIDLIDTLKPKGQCDFVRDFAQHLPIEIFMSIVNVSSDDREQLLAWAEGMVRPEKREDVHKTLGEIFKYVGALLDQRSDSDAEDLISKVTRAKFHDRALTREEQIGMCALVLIGGMDTVVSAMSFAAHFLARSPAHRHQLIAEPELIPNAVDELLRRFPIVNQGRMVRADMEFKGVHLKAGDMVLMPTTLHGLDEREFENPLEVNFRRDKPAMNSTFGNGPHRCPGSNLARNELRIFLEEWLKRIPDFEVTPGDRAGMSSGVNGTIYYLPLSWQAG